MPKTLHDDVPLIEFAANIVQPAAEPAKALVEGFEQGVQLAENALGSILHGVFESGEAGRLAGRQRAAENAHHRKNGSASSDLASRA